MHCAYILRAAGSARALFIEGARQVMMALAEGRQTLDTDHDPIPDAGPALVTLLPASRRSSDQEWNSTVRRA